MARSWVPRQKRVGQNNDTPDVYSRGSRSSWRTGGFLETHFASGQAKIDGTSPPFDLKDPAVIEEGARLFRASSITRRCERAQGRIIAHVFHRYGKPIKSLRRAWRTACKDAGRPGLLLHDLRRSAVRNLERAGIPRSFAVKLTGHRTEAVCRRYAIVAASALREAGTKLAAALGTAAATASLSDNSVTARKGRSPNA